jgi:hypothetical protein
MSYFTEDPLWMIFLGVAVEAVLAVILFRTGRGYVLWMMIGVALLAVLGLIVEKLIVTEREEVEATLDDIAAALEANDLDRVLSYLAPEARHSRERARWALGRVIVKSANIYRLKITVNKLDHPHTAKAEFLGYIAYRDRKGEIPYENYGSNFTVDLRKEDGRWVVLDHTEEYEVH